MNKPHDFEAALRAFEQAWQAGTHPDIAAFLPSHHVQSSDYRNELLGELVCVDLEFRWKRSRSVGTYDPSGIGVPTVERYLERFPELGPLSQVALELITEEYRVRHRWGDKPTHGVILARYPGRADAILAALLRIDEELRLEQGAEPASVRRSRVGTPDRGGVDPPGGQSCLSYDDYVLRQQIGAGATGKVYRATQKGSQRQVAVKYLRKAFLTNPRAVERFIQEAGIASQFEHPGIVSVHGLGRTPAGGYFIVMDLISGGNLQQRIDSNDVTPSDVVGWIAEAAEAIEHAHGRGVYHCDLKPSNLLLDEDGHVRITDFGFARLATDDSSAGPIAGTAGFMAPEQVSEFWGRIGQRTDVYGLGAVLYALLTSQPPYQGRRIADVLAHVVSHHPVPALPQLPSGTPELLVSICRKCLAKSPSDRFGTAAELWQALHFPA